MDRRGKISAGTLATALAALLGCGEKAATDTQEAAASVGPVGPVAVAVADSAGIRIVAISGSVDSLPEWSLSETPITEIRSDAEPFIGNVGEVAFLGQDQLVVEDDQTAELRVFDADGHVVRLLGGKGDGPGEFQRITQLSVTPGDTVYAFDLVHSRLSGFDPGGALVTTMPVPNGFAGGRTYAEDGWALGPDRFLRVGKRDPDPKVSGSVEGPVHLVVRDWVIDVVSRDGTPLASPIDLPGEAMISGDRFYAPYPFFNRPVVTVNGSGILSTSGRAYELILRDFDLQPVLVIRWSGWEQPLSESLAETLHDSMKESLDTLRGRIDPKAITLNRPLIEHYFSPELLPDTLPALGSALLDEAGGIWVSSYRPPGDFFRAMAGAGSDWHQEDVWHVLDADGSPIARVRLPPETRLLAVRSDRVIVVTRDGLGTQSVRILAISKP